MYIPAHFEQPDIGAMHGLIRAYPLASLVTLSSAGFNANLIPHSATALTKPIRALRIVIYFLGNESLMPAIEYFSCFSWTKIRAYAQLT
jgi:hypothetical protein